MTGSLNTEITIGKETTYGTAQVSTVRSYEGYADTFKRDQQRLESTGFRADDQGLRSDRVVQVNMGGTGSLELDFMNKGMGLLLEGLAGTTVGPTIVAATSAYTQSHSSDDCGPEASYTVQTTRNLVDAGVATFTHQGCKPTSWSLTQAAGELLKLGVDFDFEDVDIATGKATAAYAAGQTPFSWADAAVTIDGTTFGYANSFDFSADLGMNTERRYLNATSPLKSVPVRSGRPTYTGTIDADFASTVQYEAWLAGSVFPISCVWTGVTDGIESGHAHTVTLTIPAAQFTGESPVGSNSDVSKQSLPYQALWNGTDDMFTITVKSTDTAL